ncbi:hypothetical protein PQX77_008958 [Marasmius sp. AFHP31]|nr:hypothetical protein PQX77_008958 [Marasmius sp. AFHP31]
MASQDGLEDFLGPLLTVQTIVAQPIATLTSMSLVYGMYIIVFVLSVDIFYRQQKTGVRNRLYLVCSVSLFALGTVYFVSTMIGVARQTVIGFRATKSRDLEPLWRYVQHDTGANACVTMAALTSAIMNALADIMLIHRCYIVWGSKKVLLYPLSFSAFVLNCTDLLAFPGQSLSFLVADAIMMAVALSIPAVEHLEEKVFTIDTGVSIAIAVFNAILSLLTGGRIWWISREARRLMGSPVHARYSAIVAAILESGLLLPVCMITMVVLRYAVDPQSRGIVPIDFSVISALVSGFAPTLIVVRVAYGKSVDSVQQVMSIHFAEQSSHPISGPTATGVLRGTVDIRSRPQHVNHEGSVEAIKDEDKINEARTTP